MPNPLPLLDRIATRLVREFPAERLAVAGERAIVSFTFDDVPESTLNNGGPILEANGARGTFYLAGGLSGLSDYGCAMLPTTRYRELAARGHEVGCHTFSHATVRALRPAELAAELDRNACCLAEASDGLVMRNFAFPKTVASPHVWRELRRRFRSCRGGFPAINRGVVDCSYLSSVEIRPISPVDRLIGWIDDLAADSGWLIFFTHDVSPEPSAYGCPPETLRRLVDHALARGCSIMTVDAALDALELRMDKAAVPCP